METHAPRSDVRDLGDGRDGSVSANGNSRRTTIFVLASLAFLIACGVLAVQFFFVERLPELTTAKLADAKKLWQEKGPTDYDMDIEVRGAQPGNVHVEVHHRVVTASSRDGRATPEWTWDTWSVPGMFDTLVQELQIAEDSQQDIHAAPGTKWRLRCEFDKQFGFPLRYHRVVPGGPEVYWQVTRFASK
ncbi:MAG TPA: DUF6174 domain-containing protein [Lacipirellulaceae bacterium]|nr:DUF6174 domain-containing protein [Lacipirellulaceae bacterium]